MCHRPDSFLPRVLSCKRPLEGSDESFSLPQSKKTRKVPDSSVNFTVPTDTELVLTQHSSLGPTSQPSTFSGCTKEQPLENEEHTNDFSPQSGLDSCGAEELPDEGLEDCGDEEENKLVAMLCLQDLGFLQKDEYQEDSSLSARCSGALERFTPQEFTSEEGLEGECLGQADGDEDEDDKAVARLCLRDLLHSMAVTTSGENGLAMEPLEHKLGDKFERGAETNEDDWDKAIAAMCLKDLEANYEHYYCQNDGVYTGVESSSCSAAQQIDLTREANCCTSPLKEA